MNEYFASYPGAQSDRDGRRDAGETRGRADPREVELANAKARVNADFDHLSKSIGAGADSSAGLEDSEILLLLEVLEEKRAEELKAPMSAEWIRSWQANGRARSVLLKDPRAALIYRARDQRRRAAADRPVRYLGFVDEAGFRVFQFGRLPETESSPRYRVSVSLAFFSRDKILLQDGPGFCAALLSRRGEPDDCVASLEDLDNFLATRMPKATHKNRARPRYDAKRTW
jgi:hypothetical protein